jgi:ribosomal protein L7/L12
MERFIILVGLGVILVVVVSVSFRLIEMRSRTVSQLYRVEAKLDLLLKQANIEFDPYANLPREVADAARAGKTIQAIKLYRQSSEASLKEAKDFIEEYQRRVK